MQCWTDMKIERLLILLSFLLVSCMGQSGGGNSRKSSSKDSQTTTNASGASSTAPTFPVSNNFFQNGASISSSGFSLDIDFKDTFYFRGKEIHQFMAQGNSATSQCIVVNFPNIDSGARALVLLASPKSFFNFATNSKEYFYLVSPSETSQNQGFCQTPGVLTYAANNFPSSTLVYNLDSLCNNCSQLFLTSTSVAIINNGGVNIPAIKTFYLGIQIKTLIGSGTSNTSGSSCSTSSECVSKGFDCCSQGICVTDLELKNGVDKTSSEYLQAVNDITINPSHVYNYPNFYHLCAVQVVATPTPLATINPFDEEVKRFKKLRELYECTSPVTGEMSICTSTYTDASKNAGPYTSGADDRSFTTTYSGTKTLPQHAIKEIIHAGVTLYKDGASFGSGYSIGPGNDNLSDKTTITLTRTPDVSAPDDDLKIKYMIDGSCTLVNSSLAKCKKYYVQGQNLTSLDDHYPASNKFKLPYYADVNRTIKVEVDATPKIAGTHWNVVSGNPAYIQFVGTSLQVYDTQKIMIEFFVDLGTYNVLQSKLNALNEIDTLCNCGGPVCSLAPFKQVINGTSQIVDYSCVYPDPNQNSAPLQQTVQVTSRSVPHRYYDKSGAHQTDITFDTPEQEFDKFEYINGDSLRPNNTTGMVGFNEIYGSMGPISGKSMPAKEVKITSGKTYDIFVDFGTYSTCFNCGNDYYSTLAKIFPANFLNKGGGYRPTITQTDKFKTDPLRADDLLFGRACFVPATMIPWTHAKNIDRATQRQNRLSAQHFLFANGYSRDWYGFDYGAVIGSFDGVTWFAVGNQRRIKAKGNRLYLAINAFFGDLAIDTNFTITISDANLTIGSGSQITTDEASDGAECRQYHKCEHDQDCATQLGWDYTCESISAVKTTWPVFDANGLEIPDSESTGLTMMSLLQGTVNGKRCVYRGRGAPCHINYANVDGSATFNGVTSTTDTGSTKLNTSLTAGLLACAPNFYCQAFITSGDAAKFNNRIARFAKSPMAQNLSSLVTESDLDTFGLGARVLGRPYKYIGDETITSPTARQNLSKNNVKAICLPGKDPNLSDTTTFEAQNSKEPTPSATDNYKGDQIGNMGSTKASKSASSTYMAACPVFDASGDYVYKVAPLQTISGKITATDNTSDMKYLAGGQVTTTNALKTFNILEFNFAELSKDFDSGEIDSFIYQKNRCLRTPGSACFTDQDCVANKFLATQLGDADPSFTSFDGVNFMNSLEVKFWQQALVCGQAVSPAHADYDLKKNRCCREIKKEVAIAQTPQYPVAYTSDTPKITTSSLYPLDQALSNSSSVELTRNSTLSTYYGLMKTNPAKYPQLIIPSTDSCSAAGATCTDRSTIIKQFNTIDTMASKMCCTGHWVRNFHAENGGGHKWDAAKFQSLPVTTLRCLNWQPCNAAAGECATEVPFSCDHVEDINDTRCTFKNITQSESERVFDFLGRLDLTGIPQVPIHSIYSFSNNPDSSTNKMQCRVVQDSGTPTTLTAAAKSDVLPNLIAPGMSTSNYSGSEIKYGSSAYYSAADMANFDTENGIKAVFSADTISCCKASGQKLEAGEDPSVCCTGVSLNQVCGLKDYTDVTLYFNRYVSSALKGVDIEQQLSGTNKDIYEETGYILEPGLIVNAACELKVCTSGIVALGVGYMPMNIPPFNDDVGKFNRFVQSSPDYKGFGEYWEAGLKYNNHVYCVPTAIAQQAQQAAAAGMIIHNCNQ